MRRGGYIFKLDSYPGNPIVKPEELGLTWYEDRELKTGAVFNPGATIFRDKVILAPRCHRNYKRGRFYDERLQRERDCFENYISEVWFLISDDGINFRRWDNVTIRGDGSEHKDFLYGIEDTRIIRYRDSYFLIGCGKIKPPFRGEDADRIAVYVTKGFKNIEYCGMVAFFDSRNAVIFPEDINGRLYFITRFYPNISLFPLEAGIEQLLKPAQYQKEWQRVYDERDRYSLLKKGAYPHEAEKIGVGPPPIKTDKGWLLIYHAVGEIGVDFIKSGIGRGYSICAAILDSKDPKRVIGRSRFPIYIPSLPYELYGNDKYPVDVPWVIFPVGALVIDSKLILYCGAGDKYVTLLSCNISDLVDYLGNY